MRIALVLALLLTAGCATTHSRPDGAPGDAERVVKVCIYNGLTAWMKSGLYWDLSALCDENKQTEGVEL